MGSDWDELSPLEKYSENESWDKLCIKTFIWFNLIWFKILLITFASIFLFKFIWTVPCISTHYSVMYLPEWTWKSVLWRNIPIVSEWKLVEQRELAVYQCLWCVKNLSVKIHRYIFAGWQVQPGSPPSAAVEESHTKNHDVSANSS